MDEELYGEWDDDEDLEGDEDGEELAILTAQLDELVTQDLAFDELIDVALDWLEDIGPLEAVESRVKLLDERLLDERLGQVLQPDDEELLPEDLEGLQRQLQLLQRSIEEQDKQLMCLALLQIAREIPVTGVAAG